MSVIPLSSQAEASKAISQSQVGVKEDNDEADDNSAINSSDGELDHPISEHDDLEPKTPSSPEVEVYQPPTERARSRSTVAEDVFEKRGQYGRFASRWFSKMGWSRQEARSEGMSVERPYDSPEGGSTRKRKARNSEDSYMGDVMELDEFPPCGRKLASDPSPKREKRSSTEEATPARTHELMPKLLQYTKMMFSSRNFYYSYDYDITRKFGISNNQAPQLPLHKLSDPLVLLPPLLIVPFSSPPRLSLSPFWSLRLVDSPSSIFGISI